MDIIILVFLCFELYEKPFNLTISKDEATATESK